MLMIIVLGTILFSDVEGQLYPQTKLVKAQTADGVIVGAVRPLGSGKEFNSFKGIPYAAPPLGHLRFRAPKPHGPWKGVRSALQHGNICPQVDLLTKAIVGNVSEDCLYLNVYTPTLNTNKKLPVMVWIHGGGFGSGNGDESSYDPRVLLSKEVIVVTFNYRLEVLGFLNLGLPEITGNAGMKDQVAVLKWVQKNIKNFGGDPDNVTLFGQSAGAMSVSLHLCSQLSSGLFRKAIMQSGVFLRVNDISPEETVSELGKVLGKATKDPEEMLEFLTNIEFGKLLGVGSNEKHSSFPFGPSVENQELTRIPFITKHPIEYILNEEIAQIPTLAGYNSLELAYMVSSSMDNLKTVFESTPEYFLLEDCLPDSNADINNLRQIIYNVYLNNNESKELATVNIYSDGTFCYPTHRFFNLYTTQNSKYPSYLYYFDYPDAGDKSGFGWKGASHGADISFLFNCYEHTNESEKVMTYFRDMWTNFAYHGNPTPDDKLGIVWQPYTRAEKNYMIIRDKLELGENVLAERMAFWDELYHEKGLPY